MKNFLRYALGPVAWSLAAPVGNVYKSTKPDFSTCLENQINLVNQIPGYATRVYGGMCIIHHFPTGFDTYGDLSDYFLMRITANTQLIFFSSLIITGKCQLSLVIAAGWAEVDP